MSVSNTKKPAFNADAAEEYFSDLLVYYRNTANDIFNRDNDGRHASNHIYSAEYQKYVGMQIAMREVLEYFSKYDLADVHDILGDNYDLDRLRELVEADRDGRCVLLPCKDWLEIVFGDQEVFYGIDTDYLECPIREISVDSSSRCTWYDGWKTVVLKGYDENGFDWEFSPEDIGKRVFLTREAAEAALKGEQDG